MPSNVCRRGIGSHRDTDGKRTVKPVRNGRVSDGILLLRRKYQYQSKTTRIHPTASDLSPSVPSGVAG